MTPDLGVYLHYRDAMQPDEAGVKRLGALIRRTREERGWTQKDLAEESGVSVESIKRYENGKIPEPKRGNVRAVIAALKIHPSRVPIALGLTTSDELDLPPQPTRRPIVQRIIDAVEDPNITDRELDAIAALLEARRQPPARRARRKTG
ncbi:helix-turn-helix domain-containing protein [Micromonospora sp. FIMYZ51]|uniref:helix-turn-helix domain-containing protein n=1 Tax=Micromonospora sp. FIMYZ51 TaxID=3051832 RepID=UPI00311FC6EC